MSYIEYIKRCKTNSCLKFAAENIQHIKNQLFRYVSVELQEIHTHHTIRIEKLPPTYGYAVVQAVPWRRAFCQNSDWVAEKMIPKNDDFPQ